MVDAQALIFEKRAFAIIPPRKKLLVAVQLAKNIDKTPLLDVMNRGAFGLGKMQLAFPEPDVPDVALVGRDIKIAAQQNIRIFIAGFVEKPPQALQPIQFKSEFIRP